VPTSAMERALGNETAQGKGVTNNAGSEQNQVSSNKDAVYEQGENAQDENGKGEGNEAENQQQEVGGQNKNAVRADGEASDLTKTVKEFVSQLDKDSIPKREIPEQLKVDISKKRKQELFEAAKAKMASLLGKAITDPLGNKRYFAPGKGETLDSYVLHLIAGKSTTSNVKRLEHIERARVQGVMLADLTISEPLLILKEAPREGQPGGHIVYLSMYGDTTNIENCIIVGVEDTQDGRVITSYVVKDGAKSGDKNKAAREALRAKCVALSKYYIGALGPGIRKRRPREHQHPMPDYAPPALSA